ncbi:hypothetical protein RMCBS344292_02881 [Rhizopus microsporus]|nr:hypothetical protein RMCBS344292_02881 [Rhizopus microsporus]
MVLVQLQKVSSRDNSETALPICTAWDYLNYMGVFLANRYVFGSATIMVQTHSLPVVPTAQRHLFIYCPKKWDVWLQILSVFRGQFVSQSQRSSTHGLSTATTVIITRRQIMAAFVLYSFMHLAPSLELCTQRPSFYDFNGDSSSLVSSEQPFHQKDMSSTYVF